MLRNDDDDDDNNNKSTQRVQTSANAKISAKKLSGIAIRIAGLIRIPVSF